MLKLTPLDSDRPIFQQINADASPAVASPHLFSRLTVPNLCVGP